MENGGGLIWYLVLMPLLFSFSSVEVGGVVTLCIGVSDLTVRSSLMTGTGGSARAGLVIYKVKLMSFCGVGTLNRVI